MGQKSKLWYLENFNLFKGLPKSELMRLEKITSMKSSSKNQFIYFPEEASKTIFFLKKGRIKLGSYNAEGKEMVMTILQPGEIFGELALAGEGKRTDFAQAVDEDTLICVVTKANLEDIIKRNPNLNFKITQLLFLKFKKVERKLESLLFKDSRTRIIEFLKEQALAKGIKIEDEYLIKGFLTHSEIATITATSRQTVNSIFNDLKKKNLIHIERRNLLFRDLEHLK